MTNDVINLLADPGESAENRDDYQHVCDNATCYDRTVLHSSISYNVDDLEYQPTMERVS